MWYAIEQQIAGCINDEAFNEWATCFRQNYCTDDILDRLINGTGMTKQEYLLSQKFPDAKKAIKQNRVRIDTLLNDYPSVFHSRLNNL